MKYVTMGITLLIGWGTGYGMEISLADLEAGMGPSFSREISELKKLGLVGDFEHDIDDQLKGLNEDQKNRLLAGQTKRCTPSGGGLWSSLFGSNNHGSGKAIYLLRDLHRIALEDHQMALENNENLKTTARRLEYLLALVGTGLLGSLGGNVWGWFSSGASTV